MHILALPPPCTPHYRPFGRRQGPGAVDLVKYPQQFSPGRSGQLSYPSPPMSDTQSPTRRPAQQVSSEKGQPYPPVVVNEAQRREGISPPQPPQQHQPLDPRPPTLAPVQQQHQRQHYPAEGQTRGPIHYQPGHDVENPPFGGVQLVQNYAFGYPGGVPTFLGGQGPGPQAQPTTMTAPPPLRPNKPARRTKAHVASACVNCKKAHLSCDVQRPCGRCITSGKQDSCKDVQHKKRGRPRLRDHEDRDFGRSEENRQSTSAAQPFGTLAATALEPIQQSAIPQQQRADPLRVLRRSQRGSDVRPNVPQQSIVQSSVTRPASVGSLGGTTAAHYPLGPTLGHHGLPVAFLNLDLVILKSNQAFQDLVGFLGDVRGKNLADLVRFGHGDALQRLRNDLRDERDEREPAYMAPITPRGQPDPVLSVDERDVEQVSQAYTDRPHLLNFHLPNGQYQSLQAQVRLAKTSVYFVSLVVHTRPATLLTSYLAPPTPIRAGGSASAPTSAPSMRDYSQYPRPQSSASTSSPSSPYFNFSAIRTSLPQGSMSSPSYGGSPSYGYSPTAGPEHGYFQTYQPMSQPMGHSSPYAATSRPPSVISEPIRRQDSVRQTTRPQRLEGLHLPPIRSTPTAALPSPLGQEFGESARDQVRRREASPGTAEPHPDTPDTGGKRRRLNIREVLE
ncbi:hypothetical protein K432DRAFT_214508 [Lepidopterella palustris CBS 459.81]|uniref:Zn(2)-C6 fungal-type domain-containing protein n=1 Tax=Lepidopterella palustris CBS 459.81 TaxID=1314670 RepID=A0A8E2EEZ5_9PEZI|nr:hypothetical protein K432DRAFT_214508 [Lepidopterella palustris CBS 459.81]